MTESWQGRQYQYDAHNGVFRAFDEGHPSCLVVMPTGTGKTFTAFQIAMTARSRGWRTLFLAHRGILIDQAAATAVDLGLNTSIEMANQDGQIVLLGEERADVVVGTVQTMQGDRLRSWDPDTFGLIITDECHRAAAPSHQNVYSWFRSAKHLGITATPDGSSGSIGNIYKTLAYEYKMRQAVAEGYLVPPYPIERCKVSIDLRGMKSTKGDFLVEELAERINPVIEHIADGIRQRIGERFTVVFTPDVASAVGCAQALTGLGVRSHYVAGTAGVFGQAKAERSRRLESFNRREYQCIVCCDLLFEGWDCPHVSSVVIARPTLVRYRFAQMVGRGTRLCPDIGKTDCLVVDFDWKTDGLARELVTAVELWSEEDEELNSYSRQTKARIISEARRMMDEGETDGRRAIERSKQVEREAMCLPIKLSGVKAEFEVEVYDPLNVAKLTGTKLKRYDYKGPGRKDATLAQIARLEREGVMDGDRLSLWGANKMITNLERRRKEGLATYRQVHELERNGVAKLTALAMTADQATSVLSTGRTSV